MRRSRLTRSNTCARAGPAGQGDQQRGAATNRRMSRSLIESRPGGTKPPPRDRPSPGPCSRESRGGPPKGRKSGSRRPCRDRRGGEPLQHLVNPGRWSVVRAGRRVRMRLETFGDRPGPSGRVAAPPADRPRADPPPPAAEGPHPMGRTAALLIAPDLPRRGDPRPGRRRPSKPDAARLGVLRGEGPPGPGGALHPLPRAGQAEGRAPARLARGPDAGGRLRAGDRAGQARGEPADRGGRTTRPTSRCPPRGSSRRPRSPPSRAGSATAPPGPSRPPRPGRPPPPRGQVTAEDRAFWSFRPVEDPPIPPVRDAARGRRRRSTASSWPSWRPGGSGPVAPADRRALIRRVTFDLIGLPPTPEEVEAFVADDSPEAFARVVDRLLAYPHYGERWGRHWLDVARYGEDQAHTFQARLYPHGLQATATGSSRPSTTTCPTTGSSSSRWPATSSRGPAARTGWPPSGSSPSARSTTAGRSTTSWTTGSTP